MKLQEIEHSIYFIRGQKVMLDEDLAKLYGVRTKRLNEQVQRNRERFPKDFMFSLSLQEVMSLRSQIATSNKKRGGRRYQTYAFTEQGVAMLSSVLRSSQAIKVNIEIMRTFVAMRKWMQDSKELIKKIESMEAKYDQNFKVIFSTLKQMIIEKEKLVLKRTKNKSKL